MPVSEYENKTSTLVNHFSEYLPCLCRIPTDPKSKSYPSALYSALIPLRQFPKSLDTLSKIKVITVQFYQ